MSSKKIITISLLVFLSFSLFMSLIFGKYIIDKQSSGLNTHVINTKQYIKNSIDFLINEKKQAYLKASDIIFSDDNIIKALENKDRASFYKYTKSYYERAKKRDNNFWGLHIILPDNMSFIRVHKPYVSDKLILKGKKPLIDKVNETQKQVISFDAGKFGYFLRIVTPIFSKERKYLGVAEFSVKVDSLTEFIKKEFGYESMFLVKNIQYRQFLNTLSKTPNGLTLFKSTDESFFNNYNFGKNTDTLDNTFINDENRSFSTVLTALSDTATLIVAFDVTNIIEEKKSFKENVITLISFVIFIFAIIHLFSTKLYLKNKKQVDKKLRKFHSIISENVIFSNTNLDGVLTEVSNAFCRISGYTQKQLIGSPHSIVNHHDVKKSAYLDLCSTVKENKIWKGEVKNLKPDGDSYWLSVNVSPRFDENNNKIGYTSIKQNITDKKIIENIAITDGLCGIYNRRHFDNLCEKIISASKRRNDLLCLLILDIDYFKQYNDANGHQMGDIALKDIANCLKNSLKRADDYCFRLGGEEFGIIFKVEDKKLALDFANTIRTNIEDLEIIHNNSEVSDHITASIGLVCKNAQDIKDADEIYKDTDDLLYKAKGMGRNRVLIN